MPAFAFATFLIVCPTAFFLGILFSLFPYDYPLLWASGSATQEHLLQTEAHLRLLHASPALIVRILHTMIFLGLFGLITKLYKPSESNMLFDGGSLVLYMCGIVVYVANIVKGLRIVTLGVYGKLPVDADGGVGKDDGKETVVGREDNLKVLSASNTILALVLVGVLILQAGQWYAERADERERVNIRKEEEEKEKERVREESEERSGAGAGAGAGSGGAGRRSSQKEGKKSK